MAPVSATAKGVARQQIENPELTNLIERLSSFDTLKDDIQDIFDPRIEVTNHSKIDVKGLVAELETIHRWKFEEMADLYEWIKPLNAMDAAIRQMLKDHPAILLIGPDKRRASSFSDGETNTDEDIIMKESVTSTSSESVIPQAESPEQVNAIPSHVIHAFCAILRFQAMMLKYAYNKSLYSSTEEIGILLASSNDEIASLALDVLMALASPPILHRFLQSQETALHMTTLHGNSSHAIHSRLMHLAKGWGTKGCGLGLETCVTTDDSIAGQGVLDSFAGEVMFEFLPIGSSTPKTVHIEYAKMYIDEDDDSDDEDESSSEKRRKMSGGSIRLSNKKISEKQMKSTSDLFFECLEHIGGRSNISSENTFALISRIRLAHAFHSQKTRCVAVERRLKALITVLYAHPVQDILSGYFQAQPELCTEIADLVRPIVSSKAISATGNVKSENDDSGKNRRKAAIASIVEPATTSNVPFSIRLIAIESLTALVARKDDTSTSGLSHIARLTNVLGELGVGKGQVLGLLPTLIRYSLASLNIFLSHKQHQENKSDTEMTDVNGMQIDDASFDVEELGLDLGLTFLEATKAPIDETNIESRALEFVESVLSLATSIIFIATSTSSLTDSGLVPALVSTIAQSAQVVCDPNFKPFDGKDAKEQSYCSTQLRFITSQSIQLLETAVTSHNPAMAAFHDLKVVDLLVNLLEKEFNRIETDFNTSAKELLAHDIVEDGTEMDASTRVLIFSILNCLTMVFHHQESTSRSNSPPINAADVLQRPAMTKVIICILRRVCFYGGILGALSSTLLSDVMNAEPKVVHYVYESGLASAFFKMIKGSRYKEDGKKCEIMDISCEDWHEPNVPQTPELIMSIPNTIIALGLTQDGRQNLLDANPIPELFAFMCTRKYAMPHSRCMLNEMARGIGAGLDELVRHVPSTRSAVLKSLVAVIRRITFIGQQVVDAESKSTSDETNDARRCLMHYASNIGMALEDILQNEENCSDFVKEGGIDAILDLHPLLIVRGEQLLAHICSQSAPSIANLSHSTAATYLISSVKRCAVNSDSSRIIKGIGKLLSSQLDRVEKASAGLKGIGEKPSLDASNILSQIPPLCMNSITEQDFNRELRISYSMYLLEILNTEWLSQVLSEVIRVCCQRNSMLDIRSADGRSRLDWQKALIAEKFTATITRLAHLYRSSMSEVCRIRTEKNYDVRDSGRWKSPGESKNHPAAYKLRIVCADGAVVRNGIDIDSCDSVGNLEMGEEVWAYDRCINRSGIMRYRTSWGWVSEQTRGHGREPISEVIKVKGVSGPRMKKVKDQLKGRKSSDFGIADLQSAGASILARLQNSQCSLMGNLSRVTMTIGRYRSLGQTRATGDEIPSLVRFLGDFLRSNFTFTENTNECKEESTFAMYLGNMLSIFHTCIYEERREKQYLNVPLFCNCIYFDGIKDSYILSLEEKLEEIQKSPILLPETGFYNAIRKVVKYGLSAIKSLSESDDTIFTTRKVNRVIASTLPTAFSLLRRLSSQNLLIDNSLGEYLQKLKTEDFMKFIHHPESDEFTLAKEGVVFAFRQDPFARVVHCNIAAVTNEIWNDDNIKFCPPHIFNSVFTLLLEVLKCVEDSANKPARSPDEETARNVFQDIRGSISDALRGNNFEAESTVQEIRGSISDALRGNNFEAESTEEAKSSESTNHDTDLQEGNKELTPAEKKKKAEERSEALLIELNKKLVGTYKESLVSNSMKVAESFRGKKTYMDSSSASMKSFGDDETISMLLGSFLLDICSRDSNLTKGIVTKVLDNFVSCMDSDIKGHAFVQTEKYEEFCCTSHVALLLLRALPMARVIFLQRSFITSSIQCLRSFTSTLRNPKNDDIPSWITPLLLLIDIMCQPMILPAKENDVEKITEEEKSPAKSKRRDDYDKVAVEHKKQKNSVLHTSKRISSAFKVGYKEGMATFAELPAFAPLITTEAADHCLSICLQLLRRQRKEHKNDCCILTPLMLQSLFSLLSKILRFPKVANRCLRMGGAELILGMPSGCRFKGHVSLTSQILRLMMEDESTLQIEMELQIRGAVSKLMKKQSSRNGIPVKTFIQSITHLLCRDPVIFLKAVAVSVDISKSNPDGDTQRLAVKTLSSEARAKNLKLIHECFGMSQKCDSTKSQMKTPSKAKPKISAKNAHSSSKKKSSAKKIASQERKTISKSPHQGQSKKCTKKEKQEKSISDPCHHISHILFHDAIKASQRQKGLDFSKVPFLCAFEYLEILGDLLLAVPSCSNAICSYRIPTTIAKSNSSPRGGLQYLLHHLLPQKYRDSSLLDMDKGEFNENLDEKKGRLRKFYVSVKTAQASARLLVGLVARVGDGRKKVIAELASAMKCSSLDFDDDNNVDHCMWVLQSWGEVCLGLAAPRHTVSNIDDSHLSFEVLKVMSENNMANSLMTALQNIKLDHPQAALAAASLLKPLEILTRPSVVDNLQEMFDKEEKKKTSTNTTNPTPSKSRQILETAEEGMPTEGYDPEGPDQSRNMNNDDLFVDAMDQGSESEIEDDISEDDDSSSESDDSEVSESDSESDSQSESDDDSDSMHDDNSEIEYMEVVEEERGGMSGSESDSARGSDESDNDDESDNGGTEEETNHGGIDDFDFQLQQEETQDDFFDDEDNVDEDDSTSGDDEGWTNVDGRGGLENLIFGGRAPAIRAGTRLQGGSMMDVAASVLNNILRTGEIQMEALAEIEQSLGIRRGDDDEERPPRLRIRADRLEVPNWFSSSSRGRQESSSSTNGTSLGPSPTITQNAPPDNGFSSIGSIGRAGVINYMDYLYCGPVFGGSGHYYDLILREDDEDNETPSNNLLFMPLSIDAQLFPGGTAACTQSTISAPNHPLMLGVVLAPSNSLNSCNRRVEDRDSARQRSGNTWSDFVSTSRGNVIRLHRTLGPMSQNGRRNTTDSNINGLDGTSVEFGQAFENALQFVTRGQSSVTANNNEQVNLPAEEANATMDESAPSGLDVNSGQAESGNNVPTERENDMQPDSNADDEGRGIAASECNDSTEMESSGVNNENINDAPNANSLETEDTEMGVNQEVPEQVIQETSNDNDRSNETRTSDENHAETESDEVTQSNAADPEVSSTGRNSEPEQSQDMSVLAEASNDANMELAEGVAVATSNTLVCPPGMDPDVFAQLPRDMQQEIVDQNQEPVAPQFDLDEESGLDPEVLAALPEEMRREVIEQERQERRRREQQEQAPPADPSRAEDLDPASFLASLAPDLREEVLVTSNEEFLRALPPEIQAEAQTLRERFHHRGLNVAALNDVIPRRDPTTQVNTANTRRPSRQNRKPKNKIRVDCDRAVVTFSPQQEDYYPLISKASMKTLVDLMFLLSPVRPQKLLQSFLQNLCYNSRIRKTVAFVFTCLLHGESEAALDAIGLLEGSFASKDTKFPETLLGIAPPTKVDDVMSPGQLVRKRRSTSAISMANSLPLSATGYRQVKSIPPVVARRILGTMTILSKGASKLSIDILNDFGTSGDTTNSSLDRIIGLLSKPDYFLSASSLEELLVVIDGICHPLTLIPAKPDDQVDPSKKDIENAAANGKEFVDVPRPVVSPNMLKLLCSILRLESCKDAHIARVGAIARKLCKVDKNREVILKELAKVAHELGLDAVRDLRSLSIRLNVAVHVHYDQLKGGEDISDDGMKIDKEGSRSEADITIGTPSSAVTLSTNITEQKLLQVIRILYMICADPNRDSKKSNAFPTISQELVGLLREINLDTLWEHLNACLSTVSILEGITKLSEDDEDANDDEDNDDDEDSNNPKEKKKLQNSVAGLLTRFLPTIETFFVVNACMFENCDEDAKKEGKIEALVGGESLLEFISKNKVLLNALLRSNLSLLDKGLRAMVQIPRCTSFLDFDVKRFWFKQQMRKLRSQANRRHGSYRITIRRDRVFEDAYNQLRFRNADELRGRLHVTFANEEGVDAGGLSREFFGILAKEMFNPNYALFTSTEDGCTFQPNPHSSINRDHLDYFRFVGRIVGKAVADGYLLDAHFTRSLYKHMLGIKPSYHDMQAIDPDYYKNLKMILDYNLEDIGLDLSFSTVTHWFGRAQTVDLIPNGRNIEVTEKDKEKYVNLVCQHRMTTAIKDQIKAYLDGFYDLVKPDLIKIFTPKELELVISGMPDIDISDLKKNTEYQGYRPGDKEIVWFWNILFSLSKSDKAAFLQFVTGSSKVPLNGFSELVGMRGIQKFSIHKASAPKGALMAAHTCFNSLDLPNYDSEEEMKEKLLFAIKEGSGSFGFS